jgi:hypothetical protein
MHSKRFSIVDKVRVVSAAFEGSLAQFEILHKDDPALDRKLTNIEKFFILFSTVAADKHIANDEELNGKINKLITQMQAMHEQEPLRFMEFISQDVVAKETDFVSRFISEMLDQSTYLSFVWNWSDLDDEQQTNVVKYLVAHKEMVGAWLNIADILNQQARLGSNPYVGDVVGLTKDRLTNYSEFVGKPQVREHGVEILSKEWVTPEATIDGRPISTMSVVTLAGGLATRIQPDVILNYDRSTGKVALNFSDSFFEKSFADAAKASILHTGLSLSLSLGGVAQVKEFFGCSDEDAPKRIEKVNGNDECIYQLSLDATDRNKILGLLRSLKRISKDDYHKFQLQELSDQIKALKGYTPEGGYDSTLAPGELAKEITFTYPKGCLLLGEYNKSGFQTQAEMIRRAQEEYHCAFVWQVVVTPDRNRTLTELYFKANHYFGLDPRQVKFVENEAMLPHFVKDSAADKSVAYNRLAIRPDGVIADSSAGHYVVEAIKKSNAEINRTLLKTSKKKLERTLFLNIEDNAANIKMLHPDTIGPVIADVQQNNRDAVGFVKEFYGVEENWGRIVGYDHADGAITSGVRNIEYSDTAFKDKLEEKYAHVDMAGNEIFIIEDEGVLKILPKGPGLSFDSANRTVTYQGLFYRLRDKATVAKLDQIAEIPFIDNSSAPLTQSEFLQKYKQKYSSANTNMFLLANDLIDRLSFENKNFGFGSKNETSKDSPQLLDQNGEAHTIANQGVNKGMITNTLSSTLIEVGLYNAIALAANPAVYQFAVNDILWSDKSRPDVRINRKKKTQYYINEIKAVLGANFQCEDEDDVTIEFSPEVIWTKEDMKKVFQGKVTLKKGAKLVIHSKTQFRDDLTIDENCGLIVTNTSDAGINADSNFNTNNQALTVYERLRVSRPKTDTTAENRNDVILTLGASNNITIGREHRDKKWTWTLRDSFDSVTRARFLPALNRTEHRRRKASMRFWVWDDSQPVLDETDAFLTKKRYKKTNVRYGTTLSKLDELLVSAQSGKLYGQLPNVMLLDFSFKEQGDIIGVLEKIAELNLFPHTTIVVRTESIPEAKFRDKIMHIGRFKFIQKDNWEEQFSSILKWI